MGDWGSDCESALDMAAFRVRQLILVDPNHPLLRFKWVVLFKGDPDLEMPEGMVEATAEEYYDNFWLGEQPWREVEVGAMVRTVAASNYATALDEALGVEAVWPSSLLSSRPRVWNGEGFE